MKYTTLYINVPMQGINDSDEGELTVSANAELTAIQNALAAGGFPLNFEGVDNDDEFITFEAYATNGEGYPMQTSHKGGVSECHIQAFVQSDADGNISDAAAAELAAIQNALVAGGFEGKFGFFGDVVKDVLVAWTTTVRNPYEAVYDFDIR